MAFYKNCLGGELFFQTVGEYPFTEKLTEKAKKCILHLTLTKCNVGIMDSEITNERCLIRRNAVLLCVNCSSGKKIKRSYKRLSKGGKTEHSLQRTHWGIMFGGITDKYGNCWMLRYSKN